MQRLLVLLTIILLSNFGFAQDWDDFEPPPPADFGNIPPPPPPSSAPMNDFNPSPPPSPPPDFRPSTPSYAPGSSGSGGKISLGAVHFKRTGEKKDINQINPRIEELLEEDRKLNGRNP